MNKIVIEKKAINKLDDCLLKTGYVNTDFNTDDKTPSWDGFIWLYKRQDSICKKDLYRRIPVQIKGHYQQVPYTDNISFYAETSDLINYFNETGVIFFVVYVDENDNYKIYYDTLTRLKLKRIIKGKENQETISINLRSFPVDNKLEITDILFNFANDMKMALPGKNITINDIFEKKIPGYDKFITRYSGVLYKDDPFGYFLTHETTVSIKNTFTDSELAIGTATIKKISYKGNKHISIQGKEYYTNFIIERLENNNLILKFGKNIIFDFEKQSGNSNKIIKCKKIRFEKIKGNLYERIRDINFLLDFIEKEEITINKETIKIGIQEKENVNLENFKNVLEFLTDIDRLLKKLNVEEILDCDNINENDEKTLETLINTTLLNSVYLMDVSKPLYRIKIANINLLLAAKKFEKNKFMIVDFFSAQNNLEFAIKHKQQDEYIRVPQCYVLSENDFINIDNIDYNLVYKTITNSQNTKVMKEYTYYYIKEMITGYSKRTKSKKNLRECILKSLNFLKPNVQEYKYNELETEFLKLSD